MKRCLIEINDAGIRISDASGLLRVSPGFAFLHQGSLLTGEQAAARIRTNPRAGSDRFWHQLNQAALPRPLGPARTHADLAWYHLRELWAPLADDYDAVLLSVSGDYDAERLSTLLGIARACEMPVRSVVVAAVAAAASHWQHTDLEHAADLICIDAQWHRLLLEPLQMQAGRVRLAATNPVASGDVVRHGLAALYERWAHMIAEAFLQHTRFDPLHTAASEQQLYDGLPGWLQQLAVQQRIPLQLSAAGHDFAIELEREQFSAAAADLYAPLLNMLTAHDKPLLLRQRLTLLPGLIEQLREQTAVHIVADDLVSDYLLQSAPELISDDDDEVPHHSSLALVAGDNLSAATQPNLTTASASPTHVSDGALLWAIAAEGISLPPPGFEPSTPVDHCRLQPASDGQIMLRSLAGNAANADLRLNDEPLQPADMKQPLRLSAGDRIDVAGQEFRLLRLR